MNVCHQGAGRRGVTVALVAVAAMTLAPCTLGGAAPKSAGAAPKAPAVAPVSITPPQPVIEATEVLRLADTIARALATNGRIPSGAVARLSDGGRRPLSAAQLFVVLARFLGNGYEQGVTPEHVPTPPDMIGPLEIPPPTGRGAQEVVIAASDVLAQTRATADVAESTGHLPSGIWVEGLRLTPAQFVGALATVLQHALYNGEVPDQIAVGQYLPPLDWSALPPGERQTEPPTGGQAAPPAVALPSIAPPAVATEEAPPAPAAPPPQISLYWASEPPLSGEQPLTIEYQGPPAFIRVFIDDKPKAVSNMTHFIYLWDTRLEPDGSHAIRIAAVNQAQDTLDRVETTVETSNGNFPLR